MSSKLLQLIGHDEAEKAALIAQRDECLEELDYGMARRFTRALRVVQQQLQALYRLHDPLHAEKEYISKRIKRLEASTATNTSDQHSYGLEMLAQAQEELAALQAQTHEHAAAPQSTQLHEVLLQLLQGQLTAFTLVLTH